MKNKTTLALFLLIFLASCASPIPLHTETPLPPPPSPSPEATFTPMPVLRATPPPLDSIIAGSPDNAALAVPDAAAGGDGVLSRFANSVAIQNALKEAGYIPVYYKDTDGVNVLSWIDNNGVCWFNAPEHMFDPNLNPLTRQSIEQGIAHFTPDDAGIALDQFMKIDISGVPKGYACLGALMNTLGDNNYLAMQVLLYNEQTNEVVLWMPAVFAKGENLKFVQSSDGHFGIQAGEKTLQWYKTNSDVAGELPTQPAVELHGLVASLADFPVYTEQQRTDALRYAIEHPTLFSEPFSTEEMGFTVLKYDPPRYDKGVNIWCVFGTNCNVVDSAMRIVDGEPVREALLEFRGNIQDGSDSGSWGSVFMWLTLEKDYQRADHGNTDPTFYAFSTLQTSLNYQVVSQSLFILTSLDTDYIAFKPSVRTLRENAVNNSQWQTIIKEIEEIMLSGKLPPQQLIDSLPPGSFMNQ